MVKVRDLLADTTKWAKGWYAYDAENKETNATCSDACKWCLRGAVRHCYPGLYGKQETVEEKLLTLARELFPWAADLSLAKFNDSKKTSFEHIQTLLEKADV